MEGQKESPSAPAVSVTYENIPGSIPFQQAEPPLQPAAFTTSSVPPPPGSYHHPPPAYQPTGLSAPITYPAQPPCKNTSIFLPLTRSKCWGIAIIAMAILKSLITIQD